MIAQFTRAVARRMRRLFTLARDVAAQPGRHRAALSTAAASPSGVVLFVCYGNICRSPYAEYAARKIAATNRGSLRRMVSAGFHGPGRSSPTAAIEAASRRHVDLAPHRSQLLTQALLVDADLILVMEEQHRVQLAAAFGTPCERVLLLGDLDPARFAPREIADPYGSGLREFTRTYERIDRCLQSFLAGTSAQSTGMASQR